MIFGNWRPGGLAAGRRPVRLHRRAAAAQRRRVGARAAAPARSSLLVALARLAARTQAHGRGRSSAVVVGAAVAASGTSPTDAVPERVHQRDARTSSTLLVLALASQRLRMPKADGMRYRQGSGRADACRRASTGTALRAAAARGHGAGPTRRTPASRSAPPALVDDGRVVVRLQRRERRRTASACAPSAAWSRRCTPPAAAGWSPSPASTATATLLMPCGRCRQLLWEHGGPELLLETSDGVRPMTEVLPDAFGPDDLTEAAAMSA